jgi:hypothetical protein
VFYSPIAQLVERRTVNPQVPGSSPGRGAILAKPHMKPDFNVYCVEQRKAWLWLFFKMLGPVALIALMALAALIGAYILLVTLPEAGPQHISWNGIISADWLVEIWVILVFTLNYISSGGWPTTNTLKRMYAIEKYNQTKRLVKR